MRELDKERCASLNNRMEGQFSYHIVLQYMAQPIKDKIHKKEIDRRDFVEILQSVNALRTVICSRDSGCDNTELKNWQEEISSIAQKICFPLIYLSRCLPSSSKSDSEKSRAVAGIVLLLSSCCEELTENFLITVVNQTLLLLSRNKENHDLFEDLDEKFHEFEDTLHPLDPNTSIDCLDYLLCSKTILHKYFLAIEQSKLSKSVVIDFLLSNLIELGDDEYFIKSYAAISKLLPFCKKTKRDFILDELFQKFTQTSQPDVKNTQNISVSYCLLALYCFKDYFFPTDKQECEVFSRHMTNSLWLIIQLGLVHEEPAKRKLALYLVKRLVDISEKNSISVNFPLIDSGIERHDKTQPMIFWWTSENKQKLVPVYEDFILFIETLEEKQVHVIKPVLPRMQRLIFACSTQVVTDVYLFHPSWLVTIVTRCFQHESHFMSRWGALTLLSLDFNTVKLVKLGFLPYLSKDLLLFLQENKLYCRYEGTQLGDCSPVGAALLQFFPLLFSSMDGLEKEEYLNNVLEMVKDNTWGSAAITFLFQGLSKIPTQSVLGSDSLKTLRTFLQSRLSSHDIVTRGATQCFACQMFMNLLNTKTVGVSEIFSTLASFSRENGLSRQTSLWTEIVDWLIKLKDLIWTNEDILLLSLEYLKRNEIDVDHSFVFEGYEITKLSRMLVLCTDAEEKILLEKNGAISTSTASNPLLLKSPLYQVLEEISSSLANMRSRAYVNVGKVNRALALLYHVVSELGDEKDKETDRLICRFVQTDFVNVVCFVVKQLSEVCNKADDLDLIKFYSDVVISLGRITKDVKAAILEMNAFITSALSVVAETEVQNKGMALDMLSLSVMRMILAVQRLINAYKKPCGTTFDQTIDINQLRNIPVPFTRKDNRLDAIPKAQVGRVISRFLSTKWKCFKLIFQKKMVANSQQTSDVFDEALSDLSVGSGSSDIAVFETLSVLAPQILSSVESSMVAKLIHISWSKVTEENKNSLFWLKLEALIPFVLHPDLLKQDEDSNIGVAVDEFLQSLCTNEKTGVQYLAVNHICQNVLAVDASRVIAKRLLSVLVDACYMGAVHKRGERMWLDVCAYVESLGDSCAINQLTSSLSKNDLFTRVLVLNWLLSLDPNKPADQEFVELFFDQLMQKYLSLSAETTYKQFTNSLSHRHKHRMALSLLILLPFITEKMSEQVLCWLWKGLELECHPSVRQSLEWMVMYVLLHFPSLIDSFWLMFAQFEEKRSICLCSLFLIATKLGPKIPSDKQPVFYEKALSLIVPWSMAHHYTTRIFAQAAMIILWNQCQSLSIVDVICRFSLVGLNVEFLRNNGNASNTVEKLLNNYILSTFDPFTDFSLETIFYTFPRLACIAEDEWISPEQFLLVNSSLASSLLTLPLRNASSELSLCKAGPWRMKSAVDNEDDSTSGYAEGDVQKKVMPWRQMTPDQETEVELSSYRKRTPPGGLILVTSLLDKLPNLGGLCRTSEIFGVSEFVVNSMAHVEDKMFQNLSVSAHKWLTITQVLRPQLCEFLREKRSDGYTLVGVEQTANSVSVQDYKFPKKTLLLLGNEKEGLPVELIQMLDVCVEIPQFGVIRSLNVHVCGALIVWEYTRHHLANAQSLP